MRWQRPYINVPADEYYTTKRYKALNPSAQVPPKLNELIGPHEGRDINLMKLRRKPVALVAIRNLEFWIGPIVEHGWKVMEYPQDTTNSHRMRNWEILVYLPDQEWRAKRLIRCLRTTGREEHRRSAEMGFLLGYTKECIRAFIHRAQLLQEASANYQRVKNDPLLQVMSEERRLEASQVSPSFVWDDFQ